MKNETEHLVVLARDNKVGDEQGQKGDAIGSIQLKPGVPLNFLTHALKTGVAKTVEIMHAKEPPPAANKDEIIEGLYSNEETAAPKASPDPPDAAEEQ